jgi:hypothetical protein
MNSKKLVLIIGSILYLFSCNNSSDKDKQIEDVIKFANVYADSKSKRDWNDEYWDYLCNFRSINEYLITARFARIDGPYYSNDDAWKWISDSLRLEYCSMRNNLK